MACEKVDITTHLPRLSFSRAFLYYFFRTNDISFELGPGEKSCKNVYAISISSYFAMSKLEIFQVFHRIK